ncbi:MAG: AMP-binding protein, partial [Acidobacteriota bacterium]|nr:AMP-binding protein [Acidobacteriota bacterium]
RPKGVQIPHGAVVNLLLAMQRLLQTGHGDVFPALASYAFDMCIPELYLALVSGGTTLIAPQNMAANGEELAELLLRKRATVVHATPTTWQLLLQAGFSGAGLKRAIGAEPLPLDLCTRLLQADPSLYNFYGPTETTVWSAVHHFTHPGEPVVLGKPLANTQIYILDAHLQPLPIGVRGEIYIGGDGVAHGYLNRPELSAERFLPDPFNQLSDRRIYRTGDLGRFLADGSIEFLGRSDFQIKLRGYRIELTEIENVMSTEPNVLECAVALASLSEHDKRLVGYVVYRQPAGDALEQVKQWARERVPEYMVPTVWVELERLPRSPNGKVNRNALPQPVVVATEPGSAAAMQTEMEQLVADVWIEVLRLPSVQRDDDFFALGGHSLLATQVVSRLRERLDVSFPLRLLFESPVLHELAQQLQGLAGQPAQTGIERADRTRPIPLSFAQQRLWFMDQLEPENPLYNVAYAARLYGPLRLDLVERSLQEIVKRHESLRTTFSAHNDEPVQQIHPSIELPFQVTDLTMLPEEDRLEQARALARAAVRTPFQLSRGPLIRVHLFHLAEEENALVINTHHIISDRWSLGVLSRELVALYTAMEEGLPSPLPELTIQYADFSVWQRERLSGAMLESELAYWRHALAGAPFQLRLPYDFARQQNDASWGVFYRDELAHDLAPQLRTLSRDNGATFYMTLLAAFYVLLGAASNQDEMLVGTDLANRTEVALESLIGFFVNLLPMRARLQPEQTFTQFLAQVRATAIDAFAHQEMPFDRLVEELQPERSSGQHPLVQVLFVMQNTPDIHIDFGSIRMGPLGVTSSSRFDLVLFLNNPDGEPNATWLYNPSLFKQSTIEKLARTYQQILRAICEQPEATIRNLLSHAGRVAAEGRADELKDYQSAGIRKLKEMRRKATPAS